jgi:hypothetical protein
MKRLCTLALGAAALAVAVPGCTTEDPELYLGGPAGPAAAIQISSSRIDLAAGGSATIGMRVVDAAGNTVPGVAPTVSSGNAAVATATAGAADGQWTATATITGVGLGEATLSVSGGGLTAEATALVGPGSVTLTRVGGGAAEVPSGGSADYELKLWDLAGNELTNLPAGFPTWVVTSSSAARVTVTGTEGNPLLWTATGAQPGAADLRVTTDTKAPRYGPVVTAKSTVTVVPGTFAGTLTAATAAPGQVITATKAASGPDFDADSKVTLGTTAAFVDGFTATTIRFAVPAIGTTAASTLSLLDMGASQIAQTTAFTPTKASEDVYSPGNITNDCTAPATPVDYAAARSAGNWVFLVHNGTTQGTRGCFNSGAVTGYDHFIAFTTGAATTTLNVEARWDLAGDNDIYVCTTNFASCPGAGFTGNANDEILNGVAVAASTTYYVIFSPWTGNAGNSNIRVRITSN